ncbi:hypothetical protein SCYAM73S_03471 [Streptomyces cyaneofuscatus]
MTWNENSAATISIWTTLAPDTLRERRMRSGISGVRAVAWRRTNPASRASASAPRPSVRAEAQRDVSTPTTVEIPSIRPAVTSRAPATSAPASPWPRSAGSTRTATSRTARPIGRLMKKIQCQLRASVRTPPRTWPIEAPAAPVKENTAMARARSAGSVNRVTRMPRATAALIALPTPCTNRAAISTAGEPAAPATSEAAVNRPIPDRNTGLRPTRSPRRPASRSRLPKAIR